MAIEQKVIYGNWMEQYKLGNDLSLYGSWTPIRTGGNLGYVSFLGFPPEALELIKTSKVPAKIFLKLNVTKVGAVNFGVHQQASRPTGGRPWMGTETGWYFTTTGLGWQQWDLAGLMRDKLISGETAGVTMWNWVGETPFEAHGVFESPNRMQWVIEGDWNVPPQRPRIDYPTFGVSVGDELEVRWTPPTNESNPNILKYDIAISDDNSYTWTTYRNVAPNGLTSYKIPTYALAQTRKALIAIRAYDGEFWSEWNYSDRFTIFHDVAPKAPIPQLPAVGSTIDRTAINTFSWSSDPKAIQMGYQFRWRTVASDGTRGSWNYVPNSSSFVNSTSQYYNMSMNTIPVGNFEWSVKTIDDFNLQSKWSTEQLAISANPSTAPNMIYPTYAMVHPQATMVVEWTSVDQLQYELFLKNAGGVTLWSKTGTTERSVKLDYTLSTNNAYYIQLRINSSGVWSSFVRTDFSVDFASPAIPIIQRVEENGSGVTNVVYNQGELGVDLPAITTDGTTLANGWRYHNNYNTRVTNLGAKSFTNTAVLNQESGLGITLTSEQVPIIEGATYELIAYSNVGGVRTFIRGRNSSGASISYVGDPAGTTGSSITEARVSYTLPAGTASLELFIMNMRDFVGAMDVSGISLRITSPVATNMIECYRREYTPTGSGEWELIGGNPVTSTVETGNLVAPIAQWTHTNSANENYTHKSSYWLDWNVTALPSNFWRYDINWKPDTVYTVSADYISPYGQVYLRLTRGDGSFVYQILRDGTNSRTFTTPSDVASGYIAINKNDNASATSGKIEIINPQVTESSNKLPFEPKQLEGIRGGFLDYTPASQTLYEYKLISWNLVNNTKSESPPQRFMHTFNDTIIQDVDHIGDLYFLTMVTDRSSDTEVDSALQRFTGRKDPTREYGENETTVVQLQWEVDTWFEAKQISDLLNAREVYLYRDGSGRKMFVSTDKVSMKDKQISGFVMSTEFTKTHYDATNLAEEE